MKAKSKLDYLFTPYYDNRFMKSGVVRTPKKVQINHAEYLSPNEMYIISTRERNRIAAMETSDYFSIKGISL